MDTNDCQKVTIDIEEIRRRAKDNKAENGKYYLVQAFESLSQVRNLLLTLTTAGIAYFQTLSKIPTSILLILIWSFTLGLLSYVCHYLAMMKQASYYSKIEKIFSTANISVDTYNKMVGDEQKEQESFRNYWLSFSFILLIFQAVFIIIFFKRALLG